MSQTSPHESHALINGRLISSSFAMVSLHGLAVPAQREVAPHLLLNFVRLALNVQLPADMPLVKMAVILKGAPIGSDGIEVCDVDLNRFGLPGVHDLPYLEADT